MIQSLAKETSEDAVSSEGAVSALDGLSLKHISNGQKVLMELEEGHLTADIFIMDIQLGNLNGIDIAQKILDELPAAQIIFITGFDDYYLDVYDVDHIYLLKKPLEKDRLRRALQKAAERLENDSSIFEYEFNKKRYYLPYRRILFFENDKRKIIAHTDMEEDASFYESMGRLDERLPENFVRCHNSFIINIDKVTSYTSGAVQIGEHEILISRKYRGSFKHRIMEKMGMISS